MEDVKTMLKDEVLSRIETIGVTDLGSEVDSETIDGICKLADRYITIETKEKELELKKEQAQIEQEQKEKQFEESKKQWKIGLAVGVATGFVSGIANTAWKTWFINSDRELEMNGHMHSTNIGRQGVNKVISKLFK